MKNYLKTVLFLFIGIVLCSFSGVSQINVSGELYDLAKVKNGVKNHRISSYDRSGNNRDHLKDIKPGETRTIAEISGSGIINHIWITMAPGPDRLCRNDVIIRMYWDGNDYPSVESPIGPFFGQGWDEQYNYAAFPLSAGPGNGTGLSSYFTMPFAKGARIEVRTRQTRR